MNDFEQYVQDPQGASDRITQILQQKASTMPSNQPPQPDYSQMFNPALLQSMQPQSHTPEQIKQAAAEGHPQAQAIVKSAARIVNPADQAATDSLLQHWADHPEDLDPSNSYQMMTTGAQWARQSGYNGQQPVPQMPSIQQIGMQDLSNVFGGKGSNVLGLTQAAGNDIAKLSIEKAQADRFAAMALNGGTGGAGVVAANRIMTEWNSAHPEKPMTFEQAYMAATAKQGQGVTVDPNTGKYVVAAGADTAAGGMEAGKEGGKQSAILASAGPIEQAKGQAQTKYGPPESPQGKLQRDLSTGIIPQGNEAKVTISQLPDATTRTAAISAQNMILSAPDIVSNLVRARSLNSKTFDSGMVSADTKMSMARGIGIDKDQLKASADYKNIIDRQVVTQMKTMFTRPTEYETKLVQRIEGSLTASIPERDAILGEAINYLQQKDQEARDSMDSLGAKIKEPTKRITGDQRGNLNGSLPSNIGAAGSKSGGILHQDANGNKAMVYPDGSYEEVH